jgi:hypothetical protein
LVEFTQFADFILDGLPLILVYFIVVLFELLAFDFARVVLVVGFSQGFLELDVVGVLSFLYLLAFGSVLLKVLYLFFAVCYLFIESFLGLFHVFVLEYFYLLFLFFPHCR